jgi:hypothetical protein
MTAVELRLHLHRLKAERLDAADAGLLGIPAYRADLDRDLAETTDAYVGLAVTELATLRAEVSGRNHG